MENRLSDSSSNPGRSFCTSHNTTLGKGMHSIILELAMGQLEGTGLFNLHIVTKLGEIKD